MVQLEHNWIFKAIVNGTLKLKKEDFLPRLSNWAPSIAKRKSEGNPFLIEPRFPPGRTAKLRKKLIRVGIDPISVGLPELKEPSTEIKLPPQVTYKEACKEIKYDHVWQQMSAMNEKVSTWKQTKREKKKELKEAKLPF